MMVHQQAIKIRRESRTSFITKAILYQRVSWIIQVRLLFDRKPWVHAVQGTALSSSGTLSNYLAQENNPPYLLFFIQ